MAAFRKFVSFAAFIHLCSLSDAVTIVMDCPKEFANDALNDVSCSVNIEEIKEANCIAIPTTLNFQLKRAGEDRTISLCPVELTDPCGSEQSPTVAGHCGCTKFSGGMKTFALKYYGNATKDRGAELMCSVCVETDPKKITVDKGNCGKLSFSTGGAGKMSVSLCGVILPMMVAVLFRFKP
ncbi:uncharacterized protein LOC143291676 [Babylonia areolata]|uniref:uncharacterized protein LOC143291676 n=1 Tax=Babylonia areolata TaxID=304850 RepID=UPI003FD5BF4D